MPATRSTQKATGKADAPNTPAKAASRATPRSKAKPAAEPSIESNAPASPSPARTRSRVTKASAALAQQASSSDRPPSSPAKTQVRKKATNPPGQSASSPVASSPAKTRSGKRKATAALEQTPPAKTRRKSARTASRASTTEPDPASTSKDTREEKNNVENPAVASQTERERQDTDSSLSSLDSNVFDDETNNVAKGKDQAKDVPMVDADPEPNTSTMITTAANTTSAAPALQDNSNTTAVTNQGEKPVEDAPLGDTDVEPNASTTIFAAAVATNPAPALQDSSDTKTVIDQRHNPEVMTAPVSDVYREPTTTSTSTTDVTTMHNLAAAQAKSHTTDATARDQELQVEATLEATTAADANGPTPTPKASDSTKVANARGRQSRPKVPIPKTTESTPSATATIAAKALVSVPTSQTNSFDTAVTLQDKMSLENGTTSRVDSTTTTTAAEVPDTTPAPASTNRSTTAPRKIDVEAVATPGKDLSGQPTSAGHETATCVSDSGASNITPAPVSGCTPLRKDTQEPNPSTSASASSPRQLLAVSSISPLSGAVNPHAPITPNAISETDSSPLVGNEPRQAPQPESPSPPEDLVLAGQSFKVLWPVYKELRELIELKDSQGKEVVVAERKLMWKVYEQCRGLKNKLEEHERRKSERRMNRT